MFILKKLRGFLVLSVFLSISVLGFVSSGSIETYANTCNDKTTPLDELLNKNLLRANDAKGSIMTSDSALDQQRGFGTIRDNDKVSAVERCFVNPEGLGGKQLINLIGEIGFASNCETASCNADKADTYSFTYDGDMSSLRLRFDNLTKAKVRVWKQTRNSDTPFGGFQKGQCDGTNYQWITYFRDGGGRLTQSLNFGVGPITNLRQNGTGGGFAMVQYSRDGGKSWINAGSNTSFGSLGAPYRIVDYGNLELRGGGFAPMCDSQIPKYTLLKKETSQENFAFPVGKGDKIVVQVYNGNKDRSPNPVRGQYNLGIFR